MSNETGEPAFPTDAMTVQYGMTLRDYFAAKAMQSELMDRNWHDIENLANYAYDVADEMLKARNGNS
jgi:hypothetical protein